MGMTRERSRRADGPPVYAYPVLPGVPPVSALRLGRGGSDLMPSSAHAHDFLVLDYFERDGGTLRLGTRKWRIQAGDVYLIAPGEVADPSGLAAAEGWGVFFPPAVLGMQLPGAFLSWRAHPLLFPFIRGAASGAQRLQVLPADRPAWSARWLALNRELTGRLLIETDLTAAEVGQRVGYDDPGYFVRFFRRTHSTTPLAWRRAGRL